MGEVLNSTWLQPSQPVVSSTSACTGGLGIILRASLIYTLDHSPRPSGPLTSCWQSCLTGPSTPWFLAQASITSASGTIMATKKDWKRRMCLFKLLFSFNALKYYQQTLKAVSNEKACATNGLRKYTFWIFSRAIYSPCFRKKTNHHLKWNKKRNKK